jgi:diphosphomevalonate decarboxylase
MTAGLTRARVSACANIALAKYWGKTDLENNVPAVPSISLTLDQLVTETEVCFVDRLEDDVVTLDGRTATDQEAQRVIAMLNRVRETAGLEWKATVTSSNHFPTAAGLASSASGFAALAAASTRAAGLDVDTDTLSALARRSSASAARSIFGGFVELPDGQAGERSLAARQIATQCHWDVRLVLALTATGPKPLGSTDAMECSRRTSPYYQAWVDHAPRWAASIKQAIRDRDLNALGTAMEHSTFSFHSCAMTSTPGILYWNPATVAALQTVTGLRQRGASAWSTMDAGPHVKVLCEAADARRVEQALQRTPGVLETRIAKPGPGIEVLS